MIAGKPFGYDAMPMALATSAKIWWRGQVGRLRRDRPALLTFLFHGLFADAAQIAAGHAKPQQAITVDHFDRFVRHFVEAGYRFVAPADLDQLDPAGRYVMATFDDGYANNRLAMAVLERYEAPAVFFVASGHVRQGKAFWWDVLWRRRLAEGATIEQVDAESARLKPLPFDRIEAYLREQFGEDALRPAGAIDRPLTVDELRDLAAHPLVHIGNHTVDHVVLTQYDWPRMRWQIERCQADLEAITGVRPTIISYPNGNHAPAVLGAAERAGLRWGITVAKHKNRLPLADDPAARLTLGRFTLWGDQDIDAQCAMYRSDLTRYRRTPAGRMAAGSPAGPAAADPQGAMP